MSEQQSLLDEDTNDESLLAGEFIALSRELWPEALAEIVDVLTDEAIRKHALDKEKANVIACNMAAALAKHFGGRQFYLPKGDKLANAIRDNKIWSAFNGNNVDDLVKQHGLTRMRIYAILKEQRHYHTNKNQLPLFKPE